MDSKIKSCRMLSWMTTALLYLKKLCSGLQLANHIHLKRRQRLQRLGMEDKIFYQLLCPNTVKQKDGLTAFKLLDGFQDGKSLAPRKLA
ncbi:hypothetical protein Plhal304r1_c016g0058891 [Plasmopara halstedii]